MKILSHAFKFSNGKKKMKLKKKKILARHHVRFFPFKISNPKKIHGNEAMEKGIPINQ